MQVKRQYALKYIFMKIEFENLIRRLSTQKSCIHFVYQNCTRCIQLMYTKCIPHFGKFLYTFCIQN